MPQPVLKIQNLSKKYSNKTDYAVKDVSFELFSGEIVGLLGHNGAGKSTTLKCLTGMLPFDKGAIEILGYSIKNQPVSAKLNLGYVPDNHAVFERMTGREYLEFMADVYGVGEERESRISELLDIFSIGNSVDNIINSYSHGMKQKICVIGSVLHRPKLWVLDEPLTGLDAKIANALKDYIVSFCADGNTVLFSTHTLDFVEKLCTRALIIKDGRLTDDVDLASFKESRGDFYTFAMSAIGG